ncbi:hypothetical protein TrLO_g10754 [Triparma laevis f. longispina]|uniref:EF-hand domain-containing protein n=1 Tax=Triparma laevis f. longispina TaxID=1714387 RepID=A0A9W7KZ16_9STRA|nr:hypothetical protein TrLO_g10754 [Triparma laevis f. longispina]
MPSFITGFDDVFDSTGTPPASVTTDLGPISPYHPGRSPGHRLSRQVIREEEAADRLGRVRNEFNRNRLHHKLTIEEPEFDKVAKLSLPLIQRDPFFRLPSGSKSRSAKKRWKKTKTIIKDVVSAISSSKKNSPNSSPNQAPRSLKSRQNKSPKTSGMSNLFSPMKRKNKPQLSKRGEAFHSNLDEDTFQTRHAHSEPDSKPGSSGGKPPLIAKPRIMPVSKTKLERGGRRKLNAKEREKQLNKNTRIVDEMMYELESKPTMTDEDITKIIDFMDFNGSGEVDEEEFSSAVRAAKRGQISDETISSLMARVDNELRIKQIRVKDLFKQLDQSGDGVLSTDELRFGLNMLCDVSWEKECERRRLKRLANHERWKNKEEVRDKTKKWLVEGEQLPREFMKHRDYFCRDITTPERFTKYLEVVVSGPTHTKELPRSPKRQTMNGRQTEEMNSFFTYAFDPENLEDEQTHDSILQIVDDEMSIESAKSGNDEDSLGRKSRGTRKTRGTRNTRKSWGSRTKKKAAEAKAEIESEMKLAAEAEQDNSSVKTAGSESVSIATNESYDASSLTSLNTGVTFSTLETGTLATNATYKSTASAHSTAMLSQIRRSRGVKEQSDSEIESMVMLLGLNRRSILSMKQRHFEERTFRNLYSARTASLSNDYYLPQSVEKILEREELIASGGKKGRRLEILKIIEEQEAKIQEEERKRILREEYYDLCDENDNNNYDIYEDNDDSSIDDNVSLGESSLGGVSVLGYDDSTVGSVGSEDDMDRDREYEIPSEIIL